jgi:hypothetical protein
LAVNPVPPSRRCTKLRRVSGSGDESPLGGGNATAGRYQFADLAVLCVPCRMDVLSIYHPP